MTNQELAGRLVELFGGKENIKELMHCQTRVRFRVFDESKIDQDAIKALPGVFGIVIKGGQYQVVVGGEATPTRRRRMPASARRRRASSVESSTSSPTASSR